MLFSFLRNRRRRQRKADPFPTAWQGVLTKNFRTFDWLSPDDQNRLRDRIKIFVPERTWVGCGGLEMTDEVRITIAAQACLLLLGVEESYCFDGLQSVLVYPDAYAQAPQRSAGQLIVEEQAAFGEAWHRGPIVLSWAAALRGGREPHTGNLVIHEFAHHVDGLDGDVDGTPPLRATPEYRQWDRVVEHEYQRLSQQAAEGRPTLLDHYGASNRAEFFAVASECFFGRPAPLRAQHPDLYAILRNLYRQDPAAWPGLPRDAR